ncbi:MAG: MFS transporter [Candidatus Paceibacterota bacterium]|jgi:MFS family permease
MTTPKISRALFIIYLMGFLFALNQALPAYINSTFLSGFTTEKTVGMVYTFASIITVSLFFLLPRLLRRFGNYRLAFGLFVLDAIAMLGLAISHSFWLAIGFFVCVFVATFILAFTLDIFLESNSRDNKTGSIRGVYMTVINSAWVLAPLLAGFILSDGNYWKIYFTGAVLVLPALFLLHGGFRKFNDPIYKNIAIGTALKNVWCQQDLFRIFSVSFLLGFFYTWMIIYTPIYLHEHLGFSWQNIGLIFTIMLLPFVLTEAPLGKLADKKWGEKEILSLGFVITALATAAMAFVSSNSMALWAVLLFTTRIGASAIEVMSEIYFFKKVQSNQADIISLYRATRPAAYVVGPLAASILFIFVDFKMIFLALGIIMLGGLFFSLRLKDTL